MKKKHGDHIESFGVKYRVGDIVGCLLDADRNCISKKKMNVDFVSCNVSMFLFFF